MTQEMTSERETPPSSPRRQQGHKKGASSAFKKRISEVNEDL